MKRNEAGQFIPDRMYKLSHNVLPYEIELKLPANVIDNIYSFLRPKYMQTPQRITIERRKIHLNHLSTAYYQLKLKKIKRDYAKRKQEENKKKLLELLSQLEKQLTLYNK
jgi:hypothetical protein